MNKNNFIIKHTNFQIISKQETKSLYICCSGSIDLEYPQGILIPFFSQLHTILLNNHLPRIICNFKKLTYINSNTIKCIVKWITNFQSLNEKYFILFVINKNIIWQIKCIEILYRLEPKYISYKF
jgi:hypothetical protein